MSVGFSYSTNSCPKKNQKNCCAAEQITCCTFEITDNCCYEETLEIQFDFNNPIEEGQEAPDFLAIFITELYAHSFNCKQIQKITCENDPPPLKTSSQKLSILQVYRL